MSQIQFHHQQKKRKTWLLPLIVIVLLYVSIPFLLVQQGDKTMEKAITQTENEKVETPSKEFAKAVVFLQIAEVFPGFAAWAEQIQHSSTEKIRTIYELKCAQKSTELFLQISEYDTEYDSLVVNFDYSDDVFFLNAVIFSDGKKENIKVEFPDEERTKLKTSFCDVWEKFFTDFEINVPKNNSICK